MSTRVAVFALAQALSLGAALAGCGGDPVTVVVADADGPIAGADIVFHDRYGAPIAHETTGADGRASAEIDGGGMITLLFTDSGFRLRGTITGVEPGDELALPVSRRLVTDVGTAQVAVAPFAGAAVYVFETMCAAVYTSNVSAPVPLEIRSNCLASDGTLPLIVSARDGAGGMMAVAAVALPWSEPMNVAMPAWSPPSVISVGGAAAPAGSTMLEADLAYVGDGVFLWGDEARRSLAPGEAASFALPYAPWFGERLQARLMLVYGSDPEEPDSASMLIRRMAAPTNVAIDLAAELLPRLPAPSIDASVIGRPALTWSTVEVPAADGGAARLVWNEGAGSRQDWLVVIAPDVRGRVQVPELPEELESWAPTAAATFAQGTLQLADADWIASYRGLREQIGFSLAQGDQRSIFPATDATLRVTLAGDL